jgi:hypothetical protein
VNFGPIHQSHLQSADICLLRAWWDVRYPDAPDPEYAWVGTLFHAAVAAHLTGRNPRRTVEQMVMEHSDDVAWSDLTPTDALSIALRCYEAWCSSDPPVLGRGEVIAVEQTYRATTPEGMEVEGTVDLIWRDWDGRVIVEDHKTAGRPWTRQKADPWVQPQPAVYTWLVEQNTGLEADLFVFSVVTRDGKIVQRIPVHNFGPTVAPTLLRLHRVHRVLTSEEEPLPSPGATLCSRRWCRHWERCPWGVAREHRRAE